jgi:hypothetical protein
MAYGDEKVIVDVREGERAQIIYKDSEGKVHKYYPARYAYFVIENLQTLVVLNEPPKEQTEFAIVRRIRGTARLEDRGLSVVGDPESKTRTLVMSFEASDWRPKHEPVSDGELGLAFSSVLGGATLGFNRRDWEIGNDDEWWSACYLPKPFVEQIEASIASGQLTGVRVGLALRGLYSDEGDWAPVSDRSNLFIRPNREDNDIGNPDLAIGFVSSIAFTTTKVDLRQPLETEPVEPTDDFESSLRPASVDPVSAAIAALAARVEATRSTIKWVGGFIVVALLFVAGR